MKYPHLINGVWSSSGIFEIHYQTTGIRSSQTNYLIVEINLNLIQLAYYNLIAYTLAQSSTACRYRVAYAFEEIEEMIANEQGDQLQNVLHLCDPLQTNSAYDVAMVLERLIEMITAYIDQFQLVYELS